VTQSAIDYPAYPSKKRQQVAMRALAWPIEYLLRDPELYFLPLEIENLGNVQQLEFCSTHQAMGNNIRFFINS